MKIVDKIRDFFKIDPRFCRECKVEVKIKSTAFVGRGGFDVVYCLNKKCRLFRVVLIDEDEAEDE